MPENIAVKLDNIGKMYKLHNSRNQAVFDVLIPEFLKKGAALLTNNTLKKYKEFWALRHLNLTVKKGERVGIIGRNGAGKSTMLKLLTGNLVPTEGNIKINGNLSALIDVTAGFHPEFTGYENIRSSLTLNGLTSEQIEEAIIDIAHFTEIEDFLSQPFKNYSLGMQSRLTFATATTINPDILIVDEVLGAGDGYFINKATERMENLINRGSSLLLVSHSLDHIIRLCEKAVWIDRGQIAAEGSSIEVIKEYERYIRNLERVRILSQNKVSSRKNTTPFLESGNYTDTTIIEILPLTKNSEIFVKEISFELPNQIIEKIEIGAPQDMNTSYSAFIVNENEEWSSPFLFDKEYCRKIINTEKSPKKAIAVWNTYQLSDENNYEIKLSLYSENCKEVSLRILRNNQAEHEVKCFPKLQEWQVIRCSFKGNKTQDCHQFADKAKESSLSLSRWKGTGELIIDTISLCGKNGKEQTHFEKESYFEIQLNCISMQEKQLEFIPVVVIYRDDGIVCFKSIGKPIARHCCEQDSFIIKVVASKLMLGNGKYYVSTALYHVRNGTTTPSDQVFDLLDRSFEFHVYGTEQLHNGFYIQPSEWILNEV